MGGVVNGQPVDETITNNAFIFKTDDDTFTGELTAASVEATAGATVNSIQQEHNSIASFAGKTINTAAGAVPSYTNNQGFTNGENLRTRIDNVSAKFHNTTGHGHTGAAGDGTAIDVLDLSGLQLIGYAVEGTNLTSVTGGSTVVTSQLSTETPSTNDGIEGVVVNAPNNYVHIRDANGDEYLDGSGNKVYGRLTEAATVWTLTYYSNIAGTQTAYSFSGSNTVNWFYQKLFNETNRPVYSDVFVVESDQLAGTIPDATASVKGKVLLAASAQSVGATNAAGTQNGTVANADHAHRGVHSVAKSGSSALYGDVTLTGTGAATLTQSGQNIEINVPVITGGATTITGSTGAPASITAAGGIAFTGSDYFNMWFVQGSGGPVDLSANPQIAAGSIVGQRLMLRGCNNTNTVKLEDGTGLILNGECILSQGSMIELFWSGATWDEISRNML
jgi:hypothetical protein